MRIPETPSSPTTNLPSSGPGVLVNPEDLSADKTSINLPGLDRQMRDELAQDVERKQTLQVLDLHNKFSDAERSMLSDVQQRKGADAVASADGTGGVYGDVKNWYDTNASSYLDQLGNDKQKAVFLKMVSANRAKGLDSAAVYQGQQEKAYTDSVAQDSISTAAQNANLKWNDPAGAATEVSKALTAIDVLHPGLDNTALKTAAEQKIYGNVALNALTYGKDDNYEYFKRLMQGTQDADGNTVEPGIKDKIAPEMQAHLMRTYETISDAQDARKIVDNVLQGQSRPNVNLVDAVVKAESGGNPNAVSPKGARGIMQVLDGTSADPGYGVAPAKDDSPAERARVGRDYLSAMLQHYGGNQTVALAAYNWGPGNVDRTLAGLGISPGGAVPESLFLSKLPTETLQYVTKVNKAAPPTPGQEPTAGAAQASFQANQQQLRALAEQMRPGDAHFRDMILSHLTQQVGQIDHGQQLADKANLETLTQALIGPTGVTDMTSLLSNPTRAAAYSALVQSNPQAVLHLQDMVKHNATGQDIPATAQNQALWAKLYGQSTNDPAAFTDTDLNQYYGQIPLHQWQQLVQIQGAVNKRDAKEAERQVNVSRAMSALRNDMFAAGLKPGSKSPNDAEKVQVFEGQLADALEQSRQDNGKRPGYEDSLAIGRRLLTQGVVEQPWYKPNTKLTLSEAQESGKSSAFTVPAARIPKATADGMRSTWAAQYGEQPSDDTLSKWATITARQNEIPALDRAQILAKFVGRPTPSDRTIAMFYLRKQQLDAAKRQAAQGGL